MTVSINVLKIFSTKQRINNAINAKILSIDQTIWSRKRQVHVNVYSRIVDMFFPLGTMNSDYNKENASRTCKSFAVVFIYKLSFLNTQDILSMLEWIVCMSYYVCNKKLPNEINDTVFYHCTNAVKFNTNVKNE
jgi:hypothetical protein